MGKRAGTGIEEKLRRLDFGSLRVRWLCGLGTLLGVIALAWISRSFAQESERYGEISGARSEAIARSVSVFLDGDRLATLVEEHPEANIETWDAAPTDLVAMGDFLHQTELANRLAAPIRALRVRNAFQSAIQNRPSDPHPGAMEVVLSGGEAPEWREPVDYVPDMGAALFDSKSITSTQGDGDYRTFAPLENSWGETIGVTEVSVRSTPPMWMLALRLVLWTLLAIGAVFGLLKLLDVFIRRHCRALEQLALETRRLRTGDRAEPVWAGGTARELKRIASALEEWRTSDDSDQRWTPTAPAPQGGTSPVAANAAANAGASAAAPAPRGIMARRQRRAPREPVCFDLGLLIQQAVGSARQRAQVKQLELRVLMAERLPAELTGDPEALLESLCALLENAIKFTKRGCITLRVARVVDSYQLRFEVADTGVGVPWQAQPKLDQEIAQAARLEPHEAKGGLLRAAAVAAKLGGQLGFESQPGSGSRFWFTATFQAGRAVEAQLQRPAMR